MSRCPPPMRRRSVAVLRQHDVTRCPTRGSRRRSASCVGQRRPMSPLRAATRSHHQSRTGAEQRPVHPCQPDHRCDGRLERLAASSRVHRHHHVRSRRAGHSTGPATASAGRYDPPPAADHGGQRGAQCEGARQVYRPATPGTARVGGSRRARRSPVQVAKNSAPARRATARHRRRSPRPADGRGGAPPAGTGPRGVRTDPARSRRGPRGPPRRSGGGPGSRRCRGRRAAPLCAASVETTARRPDPAEHWAVRDEQSRAGAGRSPARSAAAGRAGRSQV